MPSLAIYIENDVQRESMKSLINFMETPLSARTQPNDKHLYLMHDEEHHAFAATYAAQIVGATAGVMATTFIDFDDGCTQYKSMEDY